MSAATKLRKGGAWQTITGCKVFSRSAWRTIVAIKLYSGGVWRTVGNFTAPPAPPPTSGSGSGSSGTGGGGGTITVSVSPSPFSVSGKGVSSLSQTLTVTPSGGLAPYSYSCVKTASSGPGSVAVNNGMTAAPVVTASFTDYGSISATVQITATDSLGTTSTPVSVSGTLTNNEPRDNTGTL